MIMMIASFIIDARQYMNEKSNKITDYKHTAETK